MEFINKIHLRGIVGRIERHNYDGKEIINLAVVTNHTSMDSQGNILLQSDWFNVEVRQNEKTKVPEEIQRGSIVELVGRVTTQKYIDSENNPRQTIKIIVTGFNYIGETSEMKISG